MSLLSLLSWNMNQKVSNWATVLDSGVDAALLQEAKPPPLQIAEQIDIDHEEGWGTTKHPWCAAVAVLSERIFLTPIKTQLLGAGDPDALMVSRPGTIAAAKVRIVETGEEIIVVSLYSTWANPVNLGTEGQGWLYADASAHRLISDLSALIRNKSKHKIIAAGDLNILYGYGEGGNLYWKRRYDTVFDRMSALGLRFIGPQAPDGGEQVSPWPSELPEDSRNVPTFRTHKKKPETALRQLDFVFASESIADRLQVRAANSIEEWGASDHCRIFIDLNRVSLERH